MRSHQTIARAGLLTIILSGLLLLHAATASARSCITTVAGDTCLTKCIGTLTTDVCGHDNAACHQMVAAALNILASTPAGTEMCAAAVANAKATCGCS
jgi:hypothetical protein